MQYLIILNDARTDLFPSSLPRIPISDSAQQRSRYTHYYFYLRDETLGPMVLRVASFFPFQPPITSTATPSSSRN
jgi:hypothetical protein